MLHRFCQIIAMLTTLLAGCQWCDPFGETDCVPCSPSAPYSPCAILAADTLTPLMGGELEGATLSLAECIVTALQRNPQTRVAWQASRSQAFQVGQERSALLPQLDFAAGTTRTATIKDRDRGQNPRNDINALFGVRWLLLDGGLRIARVRGAEAELLAVNFRQNTVLQDVALAVELAYYQRLAAKSLVEVAEENLRRSEYNVKLAEARLKSGVSARFDVLAAETEKANAELALVRAHNLKRVTQGRLARALGVHVTEKFDIEALPLDVRQEELADIEQLLQEAQWARPELQAALANMAARDAGVDAAGAEYYPKLSALADYGWRDDTFYSGGDEWLIGMTMELPLFTGFSRNYRRAQAWSEYELAIAQYENTSQEVGLEVWTAYSNLIEAGEAIEAAETLVTSADESLRVAAGRYGAGAGNIIELVTAQTAQTDAHTQRVRAVLSWYTALARFERTIGRTLAGTNLGVEAESLDGQP